jgi:hypothetical protein
MPLFHIRLNSLAYSSGQLCIGVHLMEIMLLGFFLRWLVSWTRGTDIGE